MRLRRLLFVAALTLGIASHAAAAAIVYTDRAAWEAAANPDVLLTFDTFQPLTRTTAYDSSTVYEDILSVGGDMTGAGMVYQHEGALQLIAYTGFGAGTVAPVLALGVDITPLECISNWGDACSTIATLRVGNNFFTLTTPMFIGLFFDTPTVAVVDGLSYVPDANGRAGRSRALIDNVAIRTVAVPEPSSLLLLSAGVVALCGRTRRT
jgi:hypothetical protein